MTSLTTHAHPSRQTALLLGAVLIAAPTVAAATERTALYLERAVDVQNAPTALSENGFWVTPDDLTRVNDFVLKPEGACLDDLCIPVPREGEDALVRNIDDTDWFDLEGFANKVQQPFVTDQKSSTTSFGPIPAARSSYLSSAIAPDFALPDREGNLHRLSDHRGKKVLIVTWASW